MTFRIRHDGNDADVVLMSLAELATSEFDDSAHGPGQVVGSQVEMNATLAALAVRRPGASR